MCISNDVSVGSRGQTLFSGQSQKCFSSNSQAVSALLECMREGDLLDAAGAVLTGFRGTLGT